jgi:UDP-N-acetylglucosamine acyltransferase
MTKIHPLAYVDSKAKLGENVVVEPFTTIYGDVEIGDNTWIGPNATIFSDTKIGSNCKVFPGAVLGAVSQDLKYKGEKTFVEIGNNTAIRECVTIHKATSDKWVTKVGGNCLIMAYAHLAHDVWVGDHCIIANSAGIAGHVQIEDYVTIEGMVGIQQFVKVGAYSFIAATSAIRKDVPPYVRASRFGEDPCVFVGVNTIGLRRKGFDDEAVKNIEDIYRILYVKNKNFSRGIKEVLDTLPHSAYRDIILNFIKESEVGVIRGLI